MELCRFVQKKTQIFLPHLSGSGLAGKIFYLLPKENQPFFESWAICRREKFALLF
ncbi:hypothetical protein [Oscillibacter sp.]|uniref:hypothetical protein n=1 Tax=Oscillibacter sp. TaxID=1945593 RepID=UPI00216C8FF8|nr:hypothetical protein [Oscillibacter sp.]MCI9113351.1 hypothetical protein [Oscillibacter sp.]